MMALLLRLLFLGLFFFTTAQANAPVVSINVKKFVIDDFISYPQQGITQESIEQVFVTWQKKLGPQLTLQQINGISDEITRLYRANGFMLARALVPPQKMRDGIVHLHIEPGVLSEIVVAGQRQTHADIVARPFKPLLHKVVMKSDIETALQQVESLPGMDAFSYFSAGDQPGETRINLKILKEQKTPTQASLRFDNFGNSSTGEYRLLGDVQVANIFGFGERYQLGVLQSLAADSSTLGYVYGSLPLLHAFWRQSFYLSNSQFQLGEDFKILDISGRGHEAHFGVQYDNFLSEQPKLELSLGDYANRIESDVVGAAVNRDNHVKDVQLSARKSWQNQQQLVAIRATLIGGHQTGQIQGMRADYVAMDVKNFGQWLFTQPGKNGSWGIDTTLRGLYSDRALPSNAQLLLAGPSVNRGFLPGVAAVDQGITWQTNLYSPLVAWDAASTPQLQPFVFIDISSGKRVGIEEQETLDAQLQLISAGLGVQTQFGPDLSLNIWWGYGLQYDSRSAGITTDLLDNDQQIYGTLTYFWK
jgi:hypothetical protein